MVKDQILIGLVELGNHENVKQYLQDKRTAIVRTTFKSYIEKNGYDVRKIALQLKNQ